MTTPDDGLERRPARTPEDRAVADARWRIWADLCRHADHVYGVRFRDAGLHLVFDAEGRGTVEHPTATVDELSELQRWVVEHAGEAPR
jgi:hypothetical protein